MLLCPGQLPQKQSKQQPMIGSWGQVNELMEIDSGRFYLLNKTTTKAKQTTAAVTTDCNATFGRTLQENFAKIESYPLAQANKYFTYFESAISVHSDIVSGSALSTGELPAIVTAASSNHYLESLEMLYSLSAVVRPAYPTIPMYYFDIGLEPHQKLEVKKICNCTVLDFPFDMFPSHVRRLKAYCRKPLIIKMVLQRYQFSMWMDASIQFKTARLNELFSQAKQYGVLLKRNVHSLPAHVNRDTVTFLDEQPCFLYKDFAEFESGLISINTGASIVNNYIYYRPMGEMRVNRKLYED